MNDDHEIEGTPTVILSDDTPMASNEIPDRPVKTSAWTDEEIEKERAKDAAITAEVKQDEKQGIPVPEWLARSFVPGTLVTHGGVDAKIMGWELMPDGQWIVILAPHQPAEKPKSALKAEYHRLMKIHGKKKAKKMMRERNNPKCGSCGVDETYEGKLDFEHRSRSEHRRLIVQGRGTPPTGDATSTEDDESSTTEREE